MLRRNLAAHDAIIDSMAQLIVRNLDPEIVDRLRQRAAAAGRSVEAEHREILREALQPSRGSATLKELLFAFPDIGDDEELFARDNDLPREIELDPDTE
jgi:antitoxin FitA